MVDEQDARSQEALATAMGEIVLCTKETNQRTRTIAYDLLVGLAARLEARSEEADPWAEKGGGLHQLFNMLLAGLASPQAHMVSASVMSISRIVFEFGSRLGDSAPRLIPAVLLLLKSKNREVVKAVLGFIKVKGGAGGPAMAEGPWRAHGAALC